MEIAEQGAEQLAQQGAEQGAEQLAKQGAEMTAAGNIRRLLLRSRVGTKI